jgi:hypothetical protein
LLILNFILCIFNLYQLQADKEKQAVPVVQLNVIRLLADVNVAVKKSEVVDMILPLFIESLEEGDASTPSLLRLRVWNLCLKSMYLLMCILHIYIYIYIFIYLFSLILVNITESNSCCSFSRMVSQLFSLNLLQLLDAVSRIASLGFEKSYRETVVLMTRSYLGKLSSIGSAESKTVAPEANTERVEVLIV